MNALFTARSALGPTRLSIDHLDPRERERMQQMGALVVDRRRVRPRYFDGRFLAARDLSRDQDYFLTRQRELARLAGAGVLAGLEVALAGETALTVTPGCGVTEAGDLVVVPDTISTTPEADPLRIDLADVPTVQRLSFELGLLDAPNRPTRRPTGLFVLALRPVEYTANPVGGYPASLTAERTAEDAEIIEATAVTLIPLGDDFAEDDPELRRALVVRAIFLGQRALGTPAEALPLAVLQLDAGIIRWVDPFLVRREIGPEHGGVAGFAPAARALREAFVVQHQQHLTDVLSSRLDHQQDLRFTASSAFQLLPPAGQLPAATVTVGTGAQVWFPPGVATAVVLVPPDEIATLVEESLLLPPIDLTASADEMSTVSVLILVPTPRSPVGASSQLIVPRLISTALSDGSILPKLGSSVSVAMSTLGGLVSRGFPVGSRVSVLADGLGSRTLALRDLNAEVVPTFWYVRCRTLRAAPDAEIVPPPG